MPGGPLKKNKREDEVMQGYSLQSEGTRTSR